MKCDFCNEDGEKAEMVIDHIMPTSRGDSRVDPANMRLVHARCHHKQLKWYQVAWRWLVTIFWRFIPHSHGRENMVFKGVYRLGGYQIYECKKCKFTESI